MEGNWIDYATKNFKMQEILLCSSLFILNEILIIRTKMIHRTPLTEWPLRLADGPAVKDEPVMGF